jgi:predicted alpha/beta hydrolase family esterase
VTTTAGANPLDGTRVVVLDGWQYRRAPGHWQGWLAERLTEQGASVDYVTLPSPDDPRRAAWEPAVRRAVAGGDTIVVAHGLSVLLWLGMAAAGAGTPLASRALLVAPPAPGAHGGDVSAPLPPSVTAAAVRSLTDLPSLIVAASDDPTAPGGAAALYGGLGLDVVELGAGRHLNESSGYGPWPEALHWCRTGQWPEAAVLPRADLEAWMAARFRPSGRRLGIAVSGDADETVFEAAAAALRAEQLVPERRMARLRPRPGETRTRPSDIIDFVGRYGHEYDVVVVPAEPAWPAGHRDVLSDVCRRERCQLTWVGGADRTE